MKSIHNKKPNPALNLAPFGRWTLRDKAAQRRLALRYASEEVSMLIIKRIEICRQFLCLGAPTPANGAPPKGEVHHEYCIP